MGKSVNRKVAGTAHPAVRRYVAFIEAHKVVLACAWLAVIGVCAYFGPQYLQATDLAYQAPPGSPSAIADSAFSAAFPDAVNSENLVVLLESPSGANLLTTQVPEKPGVPLLQDIHTRLNATVMAYSADNSPPSGPFVVAFEDYYTFAGGQLAAVAQQFMARNDTASMFLIAYRLDAAAEKGDDTFVDWLLPILSEWGAEYPPGMVKLSATGMGVFANDITKGVAQDFTRVDSVVVWIALCVLATVLRSPRLMLIPIITITVSIATTFTIMYPIANNILDVISFAPDVTVSAIIAMSIDYSLFLLSRFREEINRGRTVRDATAVMLTFAGHTIAVTGTTLSLCFFSLSIFPMSLMRSVGISTGVGVMATLGVNATLTPLLLLSFPRFFAQFGVGVRDCCSCCPRGCRVRCRGKCCGRDADKDGVDNSAGAVRGAGFSHSARKGAYHASSPLLRDGSPRDGSGHDAAHAGTGGAPSGASLITGTPVHPLDPHANLGDFGHVGQGATVGLGEPGNGGGHGHGNGHARHHYGSGAGTADDETFDGPNEIENNRMRKSRWYKLGTVLTRPRARAAIIVAVLALAAPCAVKSIDFKRLLGLHLITPRGAESTDTFNAMTADFGAGRLFPYRLLLESNATVTDGFAISQPYFESAQAIIQELLREVPDTGAGSVSGLLFVNSEPSDWTIVNCALTPSCWLYDGPIGEAVRAVAADYLDKSQRAQFVDVYLTPNPWGDAGRDWLTRARAAVGRIAVNATANPAGLTVHLLGGATVDVDCLDVVYNLFPWVIALSLSLMFVLTGLAFRSLVVPLRSVSSIALTLAWVYGLGTMVYQDGALDWTDFAGFQSIGGIAWMSPVMSMSVCSGLALDYDMFLLFRIAEFRASGLTDRAALVKAYYSVGSVITAAGLVMMIAFGGLFLSSIPSLNQLAFYLVVAVGLDTFVVRTLFVPSVLSLLGPWGFWPRAMPPAELDEFGKREASGAGGAGGAGGADVDDDASDV